jgi:hypothetical protein
LHRAVGSQAKRSAIFKLDFRPSAISAAEHGALGDWQIYECLVKTLGGVAGDLHATFDVTEPHDPSLRIGERGQGNQQAK